jgi:hypothetical protein
MMDRTQPLELKSMVGLGKEKVWQAVNTRETVSCHRFDCSHDMAWIKMCTTRCHVTIRRRSSLISDWMATLVDLLRVLTKPH